MKSLLLKKNKLSINKMNPIITTTLTSAYDSKNKIELYSLRETLVSCEAMSIIDGMKTTPATKITVSSGNIYTVLETPDEIKKLIGLEFFEKA
jgi:hypothetical protein